MEKLLTITIKTSSGQDKTNALISLLIYWQWIFFYFCFLFLSLSLRVCCSPHDLHHYHPHSVRKEVPLKCRNLREDKHRWITIKCLPKFSLKPWSDVSSFRHMPPPIWSVHSIIFRGASQCAPLLKRHYISSIRCCIGGSSLTGGHILRVLRCLILMRGKEGSMSIEYWWITQNDLSPNLQLVAV